jgi:hypothetical protein
MTKEQIRDVWRVIAFHMKNFWSIHFWPKKDLRGKLPQLIKELHDRVGR